MTVSLPAEFEYGFVATRVVRAVADLASDPDALPNALAASGRVIFTSHEKVRRASDGFVGRETIVITLNDNGVMVGPGGEPYIGLVVGNYTVSFDLESNVSIDSFPITVTTEHTTAAPLELHKVAPYVAPTGVKVQVLLVPSGTNEGDVLVKAPDGTIMGVPQSQFRGLDAIHFGSTPPTDTSMIWLDPNVASLPETGSPFELRGDGQPNGVITAPPGTYYTDRQSTAGATRWYKASGTGNTGWIVVFGDTGLREIKSLMVDGWTATMWRIRRVGNVVTQSVYVLNGSAATSSKTLPVPAGFRPMSPDSGHYQAFTDNLQMRIMTYNATEKYYGLPNGLATSYAPGALSDFAYMTADPWPTTLPGTAA